MKSYYCECGCHGSFIEAGSKAYWIFDDLGKNESGKSKLHVHSGHGWQSPRLFVSGSWKQVNKFIASQLKDEVKKLNKAIKKLEV